MEFKMQEVGFSTDLPFGNLQVAGDDEYGFRPFQLMVSSMRFVAVAFFAKY